MTILDPLRAAERIHDEYRRYLRSTFPLSRADLARGFAEQLESEFPLARGPILQASAPYVPGASVEDLIAEGVLSERMRRLGPEAFPLDRPLYLHQERAIRKAVGDRRNLVVATGTGSGKTECFLLPILDGLLKRARERHARAAGRSRAAAVSDERPRQRPAQAPARAPARPARRSRSAATSARPSTSRARRRRTFAPATRPSHCCPTSSSPATRCRPRRRTSCSRTTRCSSTCSCARTTARCSTGQPASTGASWLSTNCTSTAARKEPRWRMLLRRLRDRVTRSRPGALQCFGTSATLGRGERDYPELVEFAEALFAEPFEWRAGRREQAGRHRPGPAVARPFRRHAPSRPRHDLDA